MLAERARELGVRHLQGLLTGVELDATGAIDHVICQEHGRLDADLYIDCTGFHAELIGQALKAPFKSARPILFTDRALACKVPTTVPTRRSRASRSPRPTRPAGSGTSA